ncbi:MAG: hypothetical protein ABEJ68_07255 [Halobacteriaceae archaeon]
MLRGFAGAVGSSLTLTGAIAVGWGLHRAVVRGEIALTSPTAVAAIGGGVALVAVGHTVERRAERASAGETEDDSEPNSEFDERFSPLDAEDRD